MNNKIVISVNDVESEFETFDEAIAYLQACSYQQDCILDSMGVNYD